MIVTCTNQKGGVGKTSTVVELAYNLAAKGYKVAVCDLDPQANLSKVMNGENIPYDRGYVSDLMKNPSSTFDRHGGEHQGPVYTVNNNIDIVPAPPHKMLAAVEIELMSIPVGREKLLATGLEVLLERNQYDFFIIDTPPALGALTINALAASDKVLVPCIPEDFAVEGILQLNQTVQAVKKYCNNKLEYDGILITRAQTRTNVHKSYKEQAEKYGAALNLPVYTTIIPATVTVPDSQGKRKPLAETAADGTATEKYAAFTNEFLEVNGYDKKQ